MYYTYILKSLKDGSFYIGNTRNIENRLARHNLGHGKYTKSKTPYIVIHKEEYGTRSEAMRREKQIKSYKGGVAFKKLIASTGGGAVKRTCL